MAAVSVVDLHLHAEADFGQDISEVEGIREKNCHVFHGLLEKKNLNLKLVWKNSWT